MAAVESAIASEVRVACTGAATSAGEVAARVAVAEGKESIFAFLMDIRLWFTERCALPRRRCSSEIAVTTVFWAGWCWAGWRMWPGGQPGGIGVEGAFAGGTVVLEGAKIAVSVAAGPAPELLLTAVPFWKVTLRCRDVARGLVVVRSAGR